jgi:ribosomal protein L35
VAFGWTRGGGEGRVWTDGRGLRRLVVPRNREMILRSLIKTQTRGVKVRGAWRGAGQGAARGRRRERAKRVNGPRCVQSGKTSRGAMKRFVVSGDGTIRRGFAGRRHMLNKQTREQVNAKGGWTEVAPGDVPRAERLLGRR